ncbi:MAG TPA: glycosyltransferase [Pedobacter sp.]|jgi:hypothetical protein
MKRVLIISPYFPPSNSADMQRVRMSLPYFNNFGWEAEVVTVDPSYSDTVKDNLLIKSVPTNAVVHTVSAFSKNLTSKLGMGSIALRSLLFFKTRVNMLLKQKQYDLIYFSTTQFPVCILGAYWKKKFKVPYVIDMQDPWHSEYYRNKPKSERPAKYWFSYRLNKYLEPIAMEAVDGLISVSEGYIKELKTRYPQLAKIPAEVITFGAFEKDFEITSVNQHLLKSNFPIDQDLINVVYVGRGGHDMESAIRLLFEGFKDGLLSSPELLSGYRFHFIGTSYAPLGKGKLTVKPLAEEIGVSEYVIEQTDRVPFYEGINCLMKADALVVLGSNDPQYTASKIYPYIMARKPLLAIFNSQSSAYDIIKDCRVGEVIALDDPGNSTKVISTFLLNIKNAEYATDWEMFSTYSAQNMTLKQCAFFDKVLASLKQANRRSNKYNS